MNSIYKKLYLTQKEPLVVEIPQTVNYPSIQFETADWDIPSGATAQIYVEKPSGALIFNAASVNGNIITVTPTTQMTAETGANKAQIQVVSGNRILKTFVFILKVFASIIDDSAVESQDEFTALTTALSRLSNLVVRQVVTVDSLPLTVSNAAITARHRVVNVVIGTPSVQTDHWTVETAAGSFTISGSNNGSSTVELIFMDMNN